MSDSFTRLCQWNEPQQPNIWATKMFNKLQKHEWWNERTNKTKSMSKEKRKSGMLKLKSEPSTYSTWHCIAPTVTPTSYHTSSGETDFFVFFYYFRSSSTVAFFSRKIRVLFRLCSKVAIYTRKASICLSLISPIDFHCLVNFLFHMFRLLQTSIALLPSFCHFFFV